MEKAKQEQMIYRKLSDLKKLDRNPRIIRDKQFQTLVKSIKDNPDYFEARPIILSDRTGELVIIAGNQRYEAAKKLGMKEVPTFLLSGPTEDREREITIRDNVENGEWDFNILANEWDFHDLSSWGIRLPTWDEANLMTEENIDLGEKFDPIGIAKDFQRVVFLFKNSKEAEKYLKNLGVDYKKMNMAWQVNLCTLSI